MCGRFPDSGGLKFYSNLIRNNKSNLEAVVQSFAESQEFKGVFESNNLNINSNFVTDDPKEKIMLTLEKPTLDTYYVGLQMSF